MSCKRYPAHARQETLNVTSMSVRVRCAPFLRPQRGRPWQRCWEKAQQAGRSALRPRKAKVRSSPWPDFATPIEARKQLTFQHLFEIYKSHQFALHQAQRVLRIMFQTFQMCQNAPLRRRFKYFTHELLTFEMKRLQKKHSEFSRLRVHREDLVDLGHTEK